MTIVNMDSSGVMITMTAFVVFSFQHDDCHHGFEWCDDDDDDDDEICCNSSRHRPILMENTSNENKQKSPPGTRQTVRRIKKESPGIPYLNIPSKKQFEVE